MKKMGAKQHVLHKTMEQRAVEERMRFKDKHEDTPFDFAGNVWLVNSLGGAGGSWCVPNRAFELPRDFSPRILAPCRTGSIAGAAAELLMADEYKFKFPGKFTGLEAAETALN